MSIVDKAAWVEYTEQKDGGGRFVVQPLEKGMGITMGNAMRRVLLSSLTGFAITKLRIEGVQHEFSTLPNVVEDVLDIVSNLKAIIFSSSVEDVKVFTLEGKGKCVLSAKDVKLDGETFVLNPDLHIVELSKNGKIKIEITVEKGVGYRAASEEDEVGVINVDASFSPIIKVNHSVDNIRVGKDMGYDSLILDVYTDKSMSCDSVVSLASEYLISRFNLFSKINERPELEEDQSKDVKASQMRESALALTVDDLELSARSSNCLKRAGIQSVSELIQMDTVDLIQIKNFGTKSAEEINAKLEQYGLALKGSVEEIEG